MSIYTQLWIFVCSCVHMCIHACIFYSKDKWGFSHRKHCAADLQVVKDQDPFWPVSVGQFIWTSFSLESHSAVACPRCNECWVSTEHTFIQSKETNCCHGSYVIIEQLTPIVYVQMLLGYKLIKAAQRNENGEASIRTSTLPAAGKGDKNNVRINLTIVYMTRFSFYVWRASHRLTQSVKRTPFIPRLLPKSVRYRWRDNTNMNVSPDVALFVFLLFILYCMQLSTLV